MGKPLSGLTIEVGIERVGAAAVTDAVRAARKSIYGHSHLRVCLCAPTTCDSVPIQLPENFYGLDIFSIRHRNGRPGVALSSIPGGPEGSRPEPNLLIVS
jgi:hypothetical protein